MVSPSPQNSSISQKHNDNATLQPKLTTKKPTNTILIIERSATCTNKKEDIMRQSPVTLSPKVNKKEFSCLPGDQYCTFTKPSRLSTKHFSSLGVIKGFEMEQTIQQTNQIYIEI